MLGYSSIQRLQGAMLDAKGNASGRQQHAPQSGRTALVWLVGGGTALLVPLLLIVLALVLQLLITPQGADATELWLGGSWPHKIFGASESSWPWFSSPQNCLMALLGIGLALVILESWGLLWLNRLAMRSAQATATQLHFVLQKQAYRLGAGDILNRVSSRPEQLFVENVEEIRRGLAAWRRVIPRAPATILALLVLALAVRPVAAAMATVWAVLCWGFYSWLREHARTRSRAHRNSANQYQNSLLSDLRLAPLAATYTFESTTGESFEKTLAQHEQAAYRAAAARTIVFPLLLLSILIGVLFLIWVVGMNVLSEQPEMTLVGAATIVASVFLAYFPMYRLLGLRESLVRADEAAKEICAYLEREPGVGEVSFARPQDRIHQSVELDRVILADHNGRRLLDEVSMKIPVRGCVAMVASDLETPVALAGLLVRFYDPAAGRVLFDGRDLKHATLDSIRSQAALATGDGMLFNGRIADNLRCGEKDYTSEQLIDAARRAGAHDFISRLPQKYVTILGEKGARLEVGEAFRVGLARALLRNPSLLVLEEPRTEIDDESAAAIDGALRDLAAKQTVVVLPSRLATLRNADRIYLFHEGKLAGEGTHAELLHSSELYRHINYVRFNSFRRVGA